MMPTLEFHDVTLGYSSSAIVLADQFTLQIPRGWTGIVGANGAGKSTLLKVATDVLEPAAGRVVGPTHRVYCDQRDDECPHDLQAFVTSSSASTRRLQARLGIQDDWCDRWTTLSHGERRRAQIAVALNTRPDVLALDEPTNHVDAATRELLRRELQGFRGIGLLVSHDRELLNALCTQCMFFGPDGRVIVRVGSYSDGFVAAEREHEAALRQRDRARREYKALRAVASDRRREASHADAKRSGRASQRRDSDARAKRHAARVSGKDALAGRALNQIKGRVRHAETQANAHHVRERPTLGMTMRGVPASRSVVVRMSPHEIALGPTRYLNVPELIIGRNDRIGITGPNGAGKSTLVRAVLSAIDFPSSRVVTVPQEMDISEVAALRRSLGELPANRRGEVLSAVACLGSMPEQILESACISPGEARKLVLALGLAREPYVIVMDEPTNHLDMPSIECLEKALQACTCALMIVSHDANFLAQVTTRRWDLSDGILTDRMVEAES